MVCIPSDFICTTGAKGRVRFSRTELVHGSENVVDFLVEFMREAKLRIDVCVDHTRPGLAVDVNLLLQLIHTASSHTLSECTSTRSIDDH